GTVTFINVATNQAFGTATVPEGSILTTGLSPDGSRLYALTDYYGVYVIDTATGQVVAQIPTAGMILTGVAFHPFAPCMYVAARDEGTIRTVDLRNNRIVHTDVVTGARIQNVAVSRDGSVLFATDIERSKLLARGLTSESATFLQYAIGSGRVRNAFDVAVTPDNAQLYVSTLADGKVYVLDRATRALRDSVRTGGSARYIGFSAVAARHALERSGVPAAEVGHTVFGNALQTSADAIYCARHIGLKAGLPIEVPAVTVNRLCGSGFEAITQGAQLILLGEANAVLAGGTESMSQAPHVVRGARWGLRLGPAAPLEDLLWEALKDPQCGLSMAETAENLAERYKLTRKEVDEVALASQQRAKQAWDACVFQDEVIPVPIKQKGQIVEYRKDEHMRPETTLQVLLGLKPYFKKDGLVTAGNASGIVDGAAATVIAGEDFARTHGLKPLGRLVAWAVAGVEPKYMGIGPAPAARKALQKAGMKLEQLDLVEVNEAFAPQYLAVEKELGLDRAKTNVDGGA